MATLDGTGNRYIVARYVHHDTGRCIVAAYYVVLSNSGVVHVHDVHAAVTCDAVRPRVFTL